MTLPEPSTATLVEQLREDGYHKSADRLESLLAEVGRATEIERERCKAIALKHGWDEAFGMDAAHKIADEIGTQVSRLPKPATRILERMEQQLRASDEYAKDNYTPSDKTFGGSVWEAQNDHLKGMVKELRAVLSRLSTPAPRVTEEELADVINRARYPSDRTPRGLMDEDNSGREYARRIARAVLSHLKAIGNSDELSCDAARPRDGSAIGQEADEGER